MIYLIYFFMFKINRCQPIKVFTILTYCKTIRYTHVLKAITNSWKSKFLFNLGMCQLNLKLYFCKLISDEHYLERLYYNNPFKFRNQFYKIYTTIDIKDMILL